jgi:hypothetical protein
MRYTESGAQSKPQDPECSIGVLSVLLRRIPIVFVIVFIFGSFREGTVLGYTAPRNRIQSNKRTTP